MLSTGRLAVAIVANRVIGARRRAGDTTRSGNYRNRAGAGIMRTGGV